MLAPKTLRYQGQLYVQAGRSLTAPDLDSYYFHDGQFHGNWSDWDESLKEDVKTLRSLGVRVKLGHSAYMGHHLLMIHQDDFSKALKVIKDYRMTFRDTFRQFFKSFRSEYKLK